MSDILPPYDHANRSAGWDPDPSIPAAGSRDPRLLPNGGGKLSSAPRPEARPAARPADPDAYFPTREEWRAVLLAELDLSARPTSPPPENPQTREERAQYEAYYHNYPEDTMPRSEDEDRIADYTGDVLSAESALGFVFRDRMCYPRAGTNAKSLSPDVGGCDLPGLEPDERSYKAWRHGRLRFVFEIASKDTWQEDQEPKLEEYAVRLRPREYLYFDPERDVMRLWRGRRGKYTEIPPNEQGWFWVETAQLWVAVAAPRRVRWFKPDGTPLLSDAEVRALQARETAAREEAQAQAELAAIEREEARAQARASDEAREQAEAQARAARETAEALLAEKAVLLEELQRLRKGQFGAKEGN